MTPSHPTWKANLLMTGVVIGLLVISVMSVVMADECAADSGASAG